MKIRGKNTLDSKNLGFLNLSIFLFDNMIILKEKSSNIFTPINIVSNYDLYSFSSHIFFYIHL
jgi:hypothetical protein